MSLAASEAPKYISFFLELWMWASQRLPVVR